MATQAIRQREAGTQAPRPQQEQAYSRDEAPGTAVIPDTQPPPRLTDAEFANGEAYNRIISKAVSNSYYRRRLIADPRAVLREAGIQVPSGVEVRVRPFEEQTRYIFLPPADDSIVAAVEATSAEAARLALESGREASLGVTWWSGVVLTLEHDEVETLLQYIQAGQDVVEFLRGLGLSGIPELAFVVIATFLRIQSGLIRDFDRGSGIYLTLPWPAIWWQQWWLIVPGPR